MQTRALEGREVVRSHVLRAEVREHSPHHLLLATAAHRSVRLTSGGGTGAHDRGVAEATVAGVLRVDVVGEAALRIRYAESAEVPEIGSRFLELPGSSSTRPAMELDGKGASFSLGEHSVRVAFEPLTIDISDARGAAVASMGGGEKNLYSRWDAWSTGICRRVADDRPLAVECFALRRHEAIFGFGEQFVGGIDKVGQRIDLNAEDALGVLSPRAYKNVPFFVSSRGYGVLFNHTARMTAWVGSMSASDIQIAVEDNHLDHLVLLGTIPEVLRQLHDLTGSPSPPPAWTFGLWQSKISYSSAAETLEVVDRLRAADVPVDVVHLDTHWFRRDWFCDLEFDPERFPDVDGYLAAMRDRGVHVTVWQLPYIPEPSALFSELLAVDGFVKDVAGDVYDIGICYTPDWAGDGRVGCLDVTNPAGVEIYQAHLRRLLALGVAAIKVDFGEEAPLDGVYHDGTPGHRMHNLYPLLYTRAVAEVTEEVHGASVVWARAAWAGSQRYPIHWGGDPTSNWHNLGPQLVGGLSLGLSGFSFWSHDIGGFLGWLESPRDDELFLRWLQAGLFSSHCRIHGFGVRELDQLGEPVLRIGRQLIALRYRLLPYLLGATHDALARGVPLARALVIEFQDDPTTWSVADQWLLGDALLVAPVLEPGGARSVYLPAGRWTHWWTGEAVEGGRWVDVSSPLDQLPLWQRDGSVVALGPAQQFVGERVTDVLELRIAPHIAAAESRATVVADGRRFPVAYVHDGKRHRVEVPEAPIAVRVDSPVPVEIVRV